jgi:hypothetical protein
MAVSLRVFYSKPVIKFWFIVHTLYVLVYLDGEQYTLMRNILSNLMGKQKRA